MMKLTLVDCEGQEMRRTEVQIRLKQRDGKITDKLHFIRIIKVT